MAGLCLNTALSLPSLIQLANFALMKGNSDDLFVINRFSISLDVDTNTETDVGFENAIRAFPITEKFLISSTSTNDVNTSGSGAHAVVVRGLDANFDRQTEIVLLNGTSNVETVNTFAHVEAMDVAASASTNTVMNDGAITAVGSTSSDTMCLMQEDTNRSHISHYMIPVGYTGFALTDASTAYRKTGGPNSTRAATSIQHLKPFGLPPVVSSKIGSNANLLRRDFPAPPRIPEKSLVWYSTVADSNNVVVNVGYSLLVVKTTLVQQ